MYISLNGSDWSLSGWLPSNHRFNAESGINFRVPPLVSEIRATVPGSVHNDLWKAGLIEDPYYELNALKVEWVEHKCWLYSKKFTLDSNLLNKKIKLIFEGVNFEARFYFNGERVAIHRNMFTPVIIDITGKVLEGENLIEVLVENAPEDETQMGNTSNCRIQTCRFSYSWDFCTRLVNLGIWQDVGMLIYDDCHIGDVYLISDYKEKGIIDISCAVEGDCSNAVVEIDVSFKGEIIESISKPPKNSSITHRITIENPRLWWPNGHGSQPLYDVDIKLISNGRLQDEKHLRTGIRSLEYEMNDDAPDEAMPYTIVINGKRIWLNGVNHIAIDHMLGAVDNDRYLRNLELMRRQNVNFVRVWGGGIIEKEYFYDLCDEMGIMIWQEFTQSNSGLDGIPSVHPEFLSEFEKTAIHALKTKRNHVSLAAWSGGNELKDENRNPIGFDNPNIKMLADLVSRYDPTRIFYPSSPCGPNFGMGTDEESKRLKKNHNIHGHWAYAGPEYHYEFYNSGDYLFHGEFGVNGCSDEDEIEKFISPENIGPYCSENLVWNFHGNGWWNGWYRENQIFGERAVSDIKAFVAASQLMQAEGLRYIIEANRRRAFQCSGNNIWQFGEPWPNINCTNMISFSERPKQAYYWIKDAYANLHASLKYTRIYYREGERVDAEVWLSSSLSPKPVTVTAQALLPDGTVFYSQSADVTAPENGSLKIFDFKPEIRNIGSQIFFIRLDVKGDGVQADSNLYCFGTNSETPYKALFDIAGGKLKAQRWDDGERTFIELENTGSQVVLYVSVFPEDGRSAYMDNNFATLFPGEKTVIKIYRLKDVRFKIKDFTRQHIITL